jgi:DNA processing protein
MHTMTPRDVLIALHETEGVGWTTIQRVMAAGRLQDAIHRREPDWRDLGLSAKQAAAVTANLRPEAQAVREERARRSGTRVVTRLDRQYPRLLRQIQTAPWVLYTIGRLELLDRPALGMVGTRLATAYGRRVAEELSMACSERFTIVSGLARGIDAASHKGALEKPGSTIAVLGTPVDRCYPAENRQLYRQIAENGLLISETPPESPLHPGLFPLRNRIIAGLSLGVVVVEAAERSGALITADRALEYNRDVFVVPGPIHSPRSRGALLYFRQGAIPVIDESDIFQAYKFVLPEMNSSNTGDPNVMKPTSSLSKEPQLSADEAKIRELLLDAPRSIDELAAESGMTFGHLHSVLLSLSIKQVIHQLPGSVYQIL